MRGSRCDDVRASGLTGESGVQATSLLWALPFSFLCVVKREIGRAETGAIDVFQAIMTKYRHFKRKNPTTKI